jgi:hypothetical protein
MAQAPTQHKAALESLLTLQFQAFQAVLIVGDTPPVVTFPVTQRLRTAPQNVATPGRIMKYRVMLRFGMLKNMYASIKKRAIYG